MRHSIPSLAIIIILAVIIAGCGSKAPAPRPAAPVAPAQPEGYADAVQLQQKFQEMADQLLAAAPQGALAANVGSPAAFVNENDPSQTCALGRLIGESIYYEFNHKGIPVKEYGKNDIIQPARGKNTANAPIRLRAAKGQKWSGIVTGTYLPAKEATFVNARMIRATDGVALGTAELVLPNTPIVLNLLASGAEAAPAIMPASNTAVAPAAAAAGASAAAASTAASGNPASDYVAPQSAPARAPTYPAVGPNIGASDDSIPFVQGI